MVELPGESVEVNQAEDPYQNSNDFLRSSLSPMISPPLDVPLYPLSSTFALLPKLILQYFVV